MNIQEIIVKIMDAIKALISGKADEIAKVVDAIKAYIPMPIAE